MTILNVGDFILYMAGNTQARQAMLLTHGGYRPEYGMAGLGSSVYFYSPHTVTITFDKAWSIVRGETAANPTSISGATSSIWNYNLQTLTGNQSVETLDAWTLRASNGALEPWDWWEVDPANGSQLKDLRALKIAMDTRNHNYDVIHFLCCREWMPSSPPAPFGKLKAPKVL